MARSQTTPSFSTLPSARKLLPIFQYHTINTQILKNCDNYTERHTAHIMSMSM